MDNHVILITSYCSPVNKKVEIVYSKTKKIIKDEILDQEFKFDFFHHFSSILDILENRIHIWINSRIVFTVIVLLTVVTDLQHDYMKYFREPDCKN